MSPVLVLYGAMGADVANLKLAAKEFGWDVHCAQDPDQFRRLARSQDVVAVAFLNAESDWREVLGLVGVYAPQAKAILCHRFAEQLPWPELAEAGIFYPLAAPVRHNEARRCLGFVWSALAQEPQDCRDVIPSTHRHRAAGNARKYNDAMREMLKSAKTLQEYMK